MDPAEGRKGMMREGALDGLVVVVTGGGTGLGRGMAKHFLELGAKLCITSRKAKVLEKTAKELEGETGGEVLPIACDVRVYAEVERMRDAVVARFGKADALVHGAAGNFISPTERLGPNAFRTIIDIVLMGSVNCT